MTRATENFDDKFMKHINDKHIDLAMPGVMEHCDDKFMENCDDKGHGAF